MNHLEVWSNEQSESAFEKGWLKFARAAEKQLGHTLDGDEYQDGYSLDVKEVKAKKKMLTTKF